MAEGSSNDGDSPKPDEKPDSKADHKAPAGAEMTAVGAVVSGTATVNVADDAMLPSPLTSFTTPAEMAIL